MLDFESKAEANKVDANMGADNSAKREASFANQLEMYRMALRIRLVELEIAKRYADQRMRCPVHLSVGQEGAAVAVAHALKKTDHMVSTHRGHAHYLAKGGSLRGLLCELYGKADGCARGQGGSMHLVDWNAGFIASTSIVGGTIPVGVGSAFTSKLRNENRVVVVCIGDAAIEEGVFHESANFAALHKLPVIFACENNMYSCYTHISERQPGRPLLDIAKAHGMRSEKLDGNAMAISHDRILNHVEAARNGQGPVFLELTTYRHLEHCGPNNDDHLKYRDENDIKRFAALDPITVAESHLRSEASAHKLDFSSLQSEITKNIKSEIEAEFQYAIQAPFPEAAELGAYIYAE